MANPISLDNIDLKKVDPENMIAHLENFPSVCKEAWGKAKSFAPPSYYLKPAKCVMVGMGGSGIAGEVMRDILREQNYVVDVVHDYTLPGWVDSETLVIISSYSGNTEESIDCLLEAQKVSAKILVITTGGKIKALADKLTIPCMEFDYKSEPRAAFAYLFVSLLSFFIKIGKIELTDAEYLSAIESLEKNKEKFEASTPTKGNHAKLLAQKMHGNIPVIYSGGLLTAVGRRFKTQINENGKSFAFHEVMPELNHNATAGMRHPEIKPFVVMLESNFDHPRVLKRYTITSNLLKKSKVNFESIKFVTSNSKILEILTTVLFGDYVSYYLGLLYGDNPTEIKNIIYLKDELGK